MGLADMFKGDTETRRRPLLNVLNDGLAAAEGRPSTHILPSGSVELHIQFTREGKLEPDWLDEGNPELVKTYRDWVTNNRSRIDAVLKKS